MYWSLDQRIISISPSHHHLRTPRHKGELRMPGADLLPVPPLEGGLRHRQGPRGAPATESLAAMCQWRDGFSFSKPRLRHVKSPGTSEKWWRIGVFLPQNRFQVAKRFHLFGRNMDVHLWQSSFSGLFLNVSIDIEDPQGGPLFDINCSFGLWSAHLTVQHLCQDGCISQPCLTYRWYLCFISWIQECDKQW